MKRYTQDTPEYNEMSRNLLNAMKNHALNILEDEDAQWALSTYTVLAVDFTAINLTVYADSNWNFVYQMSDENGTAAFETIDRAASVLAAALKS
jgi:hypothetical protein